LSILAEEIKADLKLADAQIGFLYGTAFAIFYSVFGIVLGRLADVWTRKSLIAIGLTFWSVMTALSGTARGFASLAVYRFGAGGVLDAVGLLFVAGSRDGARDLFVWRVHRRRSRIVSRRHDRRVVASDLSGSRARPVRIEAVAGGVRLGRVARVARCDDRGDI